MFTLDGQGTFTTIYQGQAYGGSFIDTGSNGIYFLDSGTTQLPLCTDDSSFYCPSAAQGLSATNRGTNGMTGNVTFTIANADAIFANPIFFVSSGLGGPNPGTFDWGLPLSLGRHLFTAIESTCTPAGPGPDLACYDSGMCRPAIGLVMCSQPKNQRLNAEPAERAEKSWYFSLRTPRSLRST